MAKEATLQVRMDATLKRQAEALFCDLGTSLPEAVRIFARQSVREQRMPFQVGRRAEGASHSAPRKMPMLAVEEDAASAFAMFAAHASENKRAQEKEAWNRAACEKHAPVEEA